MKTNTSKPEIRTAQVGNASNGRASIVEHGKSLEPDQGLHERSDYYITNAEMTLVEGGLFRVRFQSLHKETHQPGNHSVALSFEGWTYCYHIFPDVDGWDDAIYTPSKPGPTWVKISSVPTCPIRSEDQILLTYPKDN
ncbi:hypothetical protein [Pseudomonas brassicacearum]|uniref:hypothetical protein n=1 Tax=Pseudomonas brassicacearum TaxID=930166 RepID=UPI0011CDFD8C|nr:hypothetical protein [Pseudomonas brassicacearum]